MVNARIKLSPEEVVQVEKEMRQAAKQTIEYLVHNHLSLCPSEYERVFWQLVKHGNYPMLKKIGCVEPDFDDKDKMQHVDEIYKLIGEISKEIKEFQFNGEVMIKDSCNITDHLHEGISGNLHKLSNSSDFDKTSEFYEEMQYVLKQVHQILTINRNLIESAKKTTDVIDANTAMIYELFKEINKDSLGILNKKAMVFLLKYEMRKFDHIMRQEDKGHINRNRLLGLALLDFDNFKQINDRYGHVAGDVVLKRFVDITQAFLEKLNLNDYAFCRYGGDEFAIIFPEIEYDTLQRTMRQLFELYKMTPVYVPESQEYIEFALSGGVVFYTGEDKVDEFIHKADQLLYQAKQKGKGQFLIQYVAIN